MGTSCAPLLADLLLLACQADFLQVYFKIKDRKLAQNLNYSFRYINDVLSLNNSQFGDYQHSIYPNGLDTTDTQKIASYLDLHLDNGGRLKTKLYDKSDDFRFPIVNFPFIVSSIPSSRTYCISQLIRCDCDFLDRAQLLTQKLFKQGYVLLS